MKNEEYLTAGKNVKYKLFHGYNLIRIFNLMNEIGYTLQTIYQGNGAFRIWFVNDINPERRFRITENLNYDLEIASYLSDNGFSIRAESKFDSIDKYHYKKDDLQLINIDLLKERILKLL